MKYKFILSDLTLFHKIVCDKVNIKLPSYVKRIKPQDLKHSTRNKSKILKGTDKVQFKCNILPKLNAFKNNYYVRTVNNWNELPLSLREEEIFENFSSALKDHLWLILGFEPD